MDNLLNIIQNSEGPALPTLLVVIIITFILVKEVYANEDTSIPEFQLIKPHKEFSQALINNIKTAE